MQIEDLLFTHLGTGITVYDTTRKVGPNYKRIALINPNRTISYDEVVTGQISIGISLYATQQNPKVDKPNGGFVFDTLDITLTT